MPNWHHERDERRGWRWYGRRQRETLRWWWNSRHHSRVAKIDSITPRCITQKKIEWGYDRLHIGGEAAQSRTQRWNDIEFWVHPLPRPTIVRLSALEHMTSLERLACEMWSDFLFHLGPATSSTPLWLHCAGRSRPVVKGFIWGFIQLRRLQPSKLRNQRDSGSSCPEAWVGTPWSCWWRTGEHGVRRTTRARDRDRSTVDKIG